MKVLHFYKTYRPDTYGGVEQVIYQLANGSTMLGVKTTVLTLTPRLLDDVIRINEHTVYRCHRNFQIASTDFSLSSICKFKELASKADIIHYHFPWPFMDLVHFFNKIQKPTILTYHSDIVRQSILRKFYQPIMNRFLKSIDAIVATSPNYLNSSKVLQKFREKVEVIPIGIDELEHKKPKNEKLIYWKKKLGDKYFLFIGVLRYYKGLHILLEALSYFDFPMVIIGSGPHENKLKLKAEKLGLKNIKFLGLLSEEDKKAVIALSYTVIFPSHLRSEAFGISLLEASIYGKPMISCEIGTGTSYVNVDGVTGVIVPPSSPYKLHLAMSYLWNEQLKAEQMGRNAYQRYQKYFTSEKMCKKYLELYQKIINNKILYK